MNDGSTFVGLDVHVATIAIAVAYAQGPVEDRGQTRNEPRLIAKRLRALGDPATLRVCYEAGPTGYTLWRQLTGLGIACQVVAPSLIPVRPGDRVKTDRRDAAKLARLLRSGDLTPIAVPSPAQEALRDLSRARAGAGHDLHRLRQRLLKSLPRWGVTEPQGMGRWTARYATWLAGVTLAQPAQQLVLADLRQAITVAETRLATLTSAVSVEAEMGALAGLATALRTLHGVGPIIAVGVLAECGDLSRFTHPSQLMAYAGLVPGEHSSGGRTQRGPITKTGNAHLRHLLVEAAWHCVRPARASAPPVTAVEQIAATARERLHRRFWRLVGRGKSRQVAIVAVARELLGFIWAIGQATAAADHARHAA